MVSSQSERKDIVDKRVETAGVDFWVEERTWDLVEQGLILDGSVILVKTLVILDIMIRLIIQQISASHHYGFIAIQFKKIFIT